MRKAVLFCALVLSLAGIGLSMAGASKPDKIHVVFFRDAAGVNHAYWLDKPVWANDALAVRAAVVELASKERTKAIETKGDLVFADSFLLSASFKPVDSGSICYVTSRSGGRAYYCGDCGGAGCAEILAQDGAAPLDGPVPPPDLHTIEIKK